MQTGAGYELDVQAIRDGAAIWITTRSEAGRDAAGRMWVGRHRPGHHRTPERAEAAVQRSEALLTTITESTEDAIYARTATAACRWSTPHIRMCKARPAVGNDAEFQTKRSSVQ